MIDEDEEDDEKPKKDKFYFLPDYVALARHVWKTVNKSSLRSNPRNEFRCTCDICFRATFKGKDLPKSDFQAIERSKAGGSHSDAGEGTSSTSCSSSSTRKSTTRCTVCWGEIAPGKHQICNKDKK